MQTNGSESSTNKANGLRLFLHFLENVLGMDANGLPSVASTCKYLRMAYKHYERLTNALLIHSDSNVNIAFSAVECHDNISLVMIHF